MKSKRYLLDLARSLTCYKHENFNIPESFNLKSIEKKNHESSKVQERMLGKKVKQSIGWENFKDVFMVSSVLKHGSSDIEVSIFKIEHANPLLIFLSVFFFKLKHVFIHLTILITNYNCSQV